MSPKNNCLFKLYKANKQIKMIWFYLFIYLTHNKLAYDCIEI